MPFYEAGDHKVDHPPLFACRDHKQFLRLRSSFIDEMVKALEDMVPSNLHEIAAPHVNGDTNAFKLPEYLIPPRVLIYNPDGLRGAAALPFTLVFIDKRFIGIPAAYLTASRFEGCSECPANPAPEPPRVVHRPPQQQPQRAATGMIHKSAVTGANAGSGVRPAPASITGTGAMPAVKKPGVNQSGPIPAPAATPPRPQQPPARKPGPPAPPRPPQR